MLRGLRTAVLRRQPFIRQELSSFSKVDPNEQRKFTKAAPEWWDARSTAGAGLLHALNPVRVGYIVESVAPHIAAKEGAVTSRTTAKPLAGLRALDVGCGGGLLSESLARLGAQVVALDPTLAAVEAARKHAAVDPLTRATDYRHTTVDALLSSIQGSAGGSADEEKFDLVCSLEVVEHVADPDSFVASCAGLVRPGPAKPARPGADAAWTARAGRDSWPSGAASRQSWPSRKAQKTGSIRKS